MKRTDNHLKKGQQAEQQACEYLEKKGLRLVQQNYRCPMGEIDLIMKDKGMLVFVEVRYRKNTKYGSGAETVTGHKQKKLLSTAMHYLQRHAKSTQACRFDVVSITGDSTQDITQDSLQTSLQGKTNHQAIKSQSNDLQWIQDAFQA